MPRPGDNPAGARPAHGGVGVSDDLQHPVQSSAAWSESYYFNFYDASRRTGGFTRIGIRPNEGTMDGVVVLFLPGGGMALAHHVREQRSNTDDIDVGGLRFDLVEPLARWRVTFAGLALMLAEPSRLTDPSALGDQRPGELVFDLAFEALSPAVAGGVEKVAEQEAARAGETVAFGHFEQAGRFTGTVTVDGQACPFAGYGNRDKSWGPREWQAPRYWRWFSANFGDDLAFGGARVGSAARDVAAGWRWASGQEPSPITAVEVTSDLAADGFTHVRTVLDLLDSDGGRHHLEGEVLHIVPLPSGRDGVRTLVNEAVVRWTYGERTGYGISEYLHQLGPDGAPLVPVL